jgi:uncharacterized protein YpmB
MISALLLSVFGFVMNIIRIVNFKNPAVFDYISVVLMLLVTVLLAVIIITVMLSSNYQLTKDKLVSKFGIVKSEILIKNITQIVHFKKTDKLVVYFDKEKYSVIVVKKDWYDDFITAILKYNPKIMYNSKSDTEE